MKTSSRFLSALGFLVILLLIGKPARVAAQDINRQLNVAVNGFDFNEAAAVKALNAGADINQKNDAMGGETLLIGAIKGYKDAKVVRFLVAHGANGQLRDNSGKTALDWAEQYNFGRNNNGREILGLLGSKAGNNAPVQTKITTPVDGMTTGGTNKTTAGGPSINQIKQCVEKNLTSAYQNHFYGVKNNVSFEWTGSIVVGQNVRRAGLIQSCYPAKLQVKITISDPRDGNTTVIKRGTDAMIGGFRKTEIFCFYKDGFGEWDFTPYEP